LLMFNHIFCLIYITLLSSTSFILKSDSLMDDPNMETIIVQNKYKLLDESVRLLLNLEGGQCNSSVAASIDVICVGVTLNPSFFVLPIKSTVDGIEVCFDKVEISPVFECAENDDDETDKCIDIVQSYTQSTAEEDELYLEVSRTKSILVKVTTAEKASVLSNCVLCNGYTLKGIRCKNKRISDADIVWCYHHQQQQQEYWKFCVYGDRPQCCTWWNDNNIK